MNAIQYKTGSIIRTWDRSFHENICKRKKEYNANRVKGSVRCLDGVISTFNFFCSLLNNQLNEVSPEVLDEMMSDKVDSLPLVVNRNEAARTVWNDVGINTIRNRIDAMLQIGMITGYNTVIKSHRKIYRLQMAKKWLFPSMQQTDSDIVGNNVDKGNAIVDKPATPSGTPQNDDLAPKSGFIDNQLFSPSHSQSLKPIYYLEKNYSSFHNNRESGENKFSTNIIDKSASGFEIKELNENGIYAKNDSQKNNNSKNFSDLPLNPAEKSKNRSGWYFRCAKSIWNQCKNGIFARLDFTPAQEKTYLDAIILQMDNIRNKRNAQELLGTESPTVDIVLDTITQAVTQAELFSSRVGYKFWPEMFFDLEVDMLNGGFKSKSVSLQKIIFEWLPKTWEKNQKIYAKKSLKWVEQRIRLRIDEVARIFVKHAHHDGYSEFELNQYKTRCRGKVIQSLNNSILPKETKSYLLSLYDKRMKGFNF